MLQALLDGELSPDQIAELAKKKARIKIPQIAASTPGCCFANYVANFRVNYLSHRFRLEKLVSGFPMTRVSRAVSTTSIDNVSRRLIATTRSIWISR